MVEKHLSKTLFKYPFSVGTIKSLSFEANGSFGESKRNSPLQHQDILRLEYGHKAEEKDKFIFSQKNLLKRPCV